jgi:DNA-binding XRE family transcriptional regulator
MATQAVTLHRRDIERLLQAAGDTRAIEQLAVSDDQAAVIVVVLANSLQEDPTERVAARHATHHDEASAAPQSRRDALARRRREVCKTQEGLAMEVGVQRSTVTRWEAGDTTPSLWARPRIANALGVTLDQLDELLGTEPQGQDPVEAATADGSQPVSSLEPPAVA